MCGLPHAMALPPHAEPATEPLTDRAVTAAEVDPSTPPDGLGSPRAPRRLLPLLGLLSMIAPFATDMYLPAFPELTADLRTTPSSVQLTLTTFLVGLALGQLVIGPLSDRWGRRPPLVAGALVCTLASAGAALAPSIEILLAARFVQGFSGAAGVVIARAVVADVYRGASAARAYSLLGVVIGIAPVAAPVLGGLLAAPVGWRGLLWVLTGLTAAMLLAALLLGETHPRARRTVAARPATGSGRRRPPALALLGNRVFVAHAAVAASAFAVLMAYISASPFVFQGLMGLDERGSGLLFALNSVGLVLMSTVNARLVVRFSTRRLLAAGLALLTAGVVALAVLALAGAPSAWLAAPLFVIVSSVGLVFGNTVALAMRAAGPVAGSGSALIGFGQFVVGAAVAPMVGLRPDAVAELLAVITAGGALAAWTAFALGRHRAAPAPRS